MNLVRLWAVLTFALALSMQIAVAQAPAVDPKPASPRPKPDTYETLYLINNTQQNDLNDIQTAMRNLLPNAHIYGEPSQHSISLWATQEDIALAHRILADLDRPKKTYQLTYTLAEMDGAKKLGSQRFTLVAVSGEKTALKLGTRVPLVTSAYEPGVSAGNTKAEYQIQYVDIGTNIEATVDAFEGGLRLHTKVEQSSVAEEKPLGGAEDPVIRQTQLDGTSMMTFGKPVDLGSMEEPGNTKHLEVQVLAEVVK